MSKLIVFNSISIDGFFTDAHSDMSFAHNPVPDQEWDSFVQANASGGGMLLFGRKTYEMMEGFWTSPLAKKNMPVVAEQMNKLPKVVFSRTLKKVSWDNATLVKGDLAGEIRKMKQGNGPGMAILGSGSIVAQLAQEGLIDEYQIVVNPVVIGKGRTMFEGIKGTLSLKLTKMRAFKNGNVLLCYEAKK
jgi:dihydrofolate reductase